MEGKKYCNVRKHWLIWKTGILNPSFSYFLTTLSVMQNQVYVSKKEKNVLR